MGKDEGGGSSGPVFGLAEDRWSALSCSAKSAADRLSSTVNAFVDIRIVETPVGGKDAVGKRVLRDGGIASRSVPTEKKTTVMPNELVEQNALPEAWGIKLPRI